MENKPYFEIFQGGKLVHRFDQIHGEISITNELQYVPTVEIDVPIEYRQYLYGRPEIKIHIGGMVFHGIVFVPQTDKNDELVTLNVQHIIAEWGNRQVSTNLAVKDQTISQMYSTLDFKYSSAWQMVYFDGAGDQIIDYVYSRQSKLDALDQTMDLTEDYYWRIDFTDSKKIEIGKFGTKKPYTISVEDSSDQNIRMISEPIINVASEDVVNMATVYGTKSDSGMSSMSLREVYDDPSLQNPNFPVVIIKVGINNEREYHEYIEYPKLAPNNELEYAVLDNESIALEGGVFLEDSFSFDDISPFSVDGEVIEDSDRIIASEMAYKKIIKTLTNLRRLISFDIEESEPLPLNVKVGDKIRFIYTNEMLQNMHCSNYMKRILAYDDWYYITSLTRTFDVNGEETDSYTLDKYIRVERDGGN